MRITHIWPYVICVLLHVFVCYFYVTHMYLCAPVWLVITRMYLYVTRSVRVVF